MEANRKKTYVAFLAAFFLILLSLQFASAQEYDAMKGVNNANVIFDMRDGIPKSAVVHMKLIHDTYKQLAAMKKNPVFVVVFMGSAVKLISSKDGISFEVCLFAAKVFGVDPASIQSEVKSVPNGWVSEIGYQARRYSLVPVY
jgi:intracellular sulfur oxidation DsrE/DsrF family protein